MKKSPITIIKKEADKSLEVTTIKNDFREMQKVVKGPIGVIELNDRIDMWYNDEFLFDNEANPNILIGDTVIQGTVFFASHDDDGDTLSLTIEQIDLVNRQVQQLTISPLPIYLNASLEELQYFEMRIAEINAEIHVAATDFDKDGDLNG